MVFSPCVQIKKESSSFELFGDLCDDNKHLGLHKVIQNKFLH